MSGVPGIDRTFVRKRYPRESMIFLAAISGLVSCPLIRLIILDRLSGEKTSARRVLRSILLCRPCMQMRTETRLHPESTSPVVPDTQHARLDPPPWPNSTIRQKRRKGESRKVRPTCKWS